MDPRRLLVLAAMVTMVEMVSEGERV
jgi:hypothetical protein